MTYVRVRSIGGMTPMGENRKYWEKTMSHCRTDHTKKKTKGTGMSSQYLLYSEGGESDDDR